MNRRGFRQNRPSSWAKIAYPSRTQARARDFALPSIAPRRFHGRASSEQPHNPYSERQICALPPRHGRLEIRSPASRPGQWQVSRSGAWDVTAPARRSVERPTGSLTVRSISSATAAKLSQWRDNSIDFEALRVVALGIGHPHSHVDPKSLDDDHVHVREQLVQDLF